MKHWTTKSKNVEHRKNFDDQLVQQFHFTISTLRTRENRFPNFTQCVGCCCVTTFLDSLCWVLRVSQAIELYLFFSLKVLHLFDISQQPIQLFSLICSTILFRCLWLQRQSCSTGELHKELKIDRIMRNIALNLN